MAENVDMPLLAKLCQDTLAETRAARGDLADVRRDLADVHRNLADVRHDLADVQRLAIKTVEVLTKMERRNEVRNAAVDRRFAVVDARLSGLDQRMSDLKDDLELMIKSEELMIKSELRGALSNFETRMISLIDERLAARE
jgi:hypothetical protein